MRLTDDAIDQALTHSCDVCGMGAGMECVTVADGIPLLEVWGVPVHDRRVEEL